MIKGMTGFGTSSFYHQGKKHVINIRSVNHKFFDCVISLPDGSSGLEAQIKKELSKHLKRGRVTFQLLSLEPYVHEPVLNKQLLYKYFNLIKNIGRSLKIKQDVRLRDIIDLPEVIYLKKSNYFSDRKFLLQFHRAIRKALGNLSALRKSEGQAIGLDLTKRMQKIAQKLKLIKKRMVNIIERQKRQLSSDELKDFMKNYNVEEEIVRLNFHVGTFKKTIRQNGALGKILDFITQEMQREINTLSAKFRDMKVSYSSVIIKDEIEKIREQLQNVE